MLGPRPGRRAGVEPLGQHRGVIQGSRGLGIMARGSEEEG